MRFSIRFLITAGVGVKRDMSCRMTSLTSSLCPKLFLSFMMRTMQAWIVGTCQHLASTRQARTYLNLMFPLFVHFLLCLRSLFIVFYFAYDRLDLDLCQRAGKAVVEAEFVARPNVSGFRILGQDLELGASERLETSKKVRVRYLGCSFDIL